MNWTGGRRSRHSHHNAHSVANVQRQHFAKIRTSLHSKSQLHVPSSLAEALSGRGWNRPAHHQRGESREEQAGEERALNDISRLLLPHRTPQERQQRDRANSLTGVGGDTATCDQGLARFDSPAVARFDVELSQGNDIASRHRLLRTTNRKNSPLLANRKQNLMKRDDWVGTTITRPLKIRYPPAVNGRTIGRRRKSTGDCHRHRTSPTAEQAGLSRVERGYVGCGDLHDCAAGEQVPAVQIGYPWASGGIGGYLGAGSGSEAMRWSCLEGPNESTLLPPEPPLDPPRVKVNSTLTTKYFTARSIAKSSTLDSASWIVAPRSSRRSLQFTQGSEDETALGTQLSSSISSKRGGSVGRKDLRPSKYDASPSLDTHLYSLRPIAHTTNHRTYPQYLAHDAMYVEEEGIPFKITCRRQNRNSLTYVSSGSEKEPEGRTLTAFPTDPHARVSTTTHSPRAEISNSNTTRTEGSYSPGISTTPDELFWRSWLSCFIGNESEVVEQTETPRTSNQHPNAQEFASDVQAHLNSSTHDAVQISSMALDSPHHSTHPPHPSRALVELPPGIRSQGESERCETPSVKCLPALNSECKKHVEAPSGDHAWQKYIWGDEGEDEFMDQFLELNRSHLFPLSNQGMADDLESALSNAPHQNPAIDSYYSQQTQGPLSRPRTEFTDHSFTATHCR
ncbi:hypothetical protein FGG08_000727 [Glutinoglossum americanum]|uniref:Uncharacterized protein n=1 Tax=Glutinoglossum americanum TaxID=1670608 RepID=A0A9P8L5T4_9PEZI|nr:hypothetical protein FGG08_000727 [Glutinoglossum americanum]